MPSFFGRLFKDNELDDIGNKIDSIISNIPVTSEPTPVENVTGKFIDQFLGNEEKKTETQKLFEQVSVPAERLARYGVYKEINRSVPIIKRIIKVYISHLLQKNPVDGKCIIYRDTMDTSDDDKAKEAKKFAKEVELNFDIPKKLKDKICPKKLLYGDCFVEVVDVKKESKKTDLSKISLLTETKKLEAELIKSNGGATKSLLETNLLIDKLTLLVHEEIDPTEDNMLEERDTADSLSTDTRDGFSEDKDSEEKAKDARKTGEDMQNPFLDIILKIHSPHNIIVLESRYGTRLGYLEVFKDDSQEFHSVSQNISNIVGKITNVGKSSLPEQKIIDKIITNILKQTLNNASDFKNSKIESTLKSLGEDVYLFIKRLFIELDVDNKLKYNKIKTRFIPVNRMVNFTIPSNDHSPYGESIVDPLILPCKLYMLAQLSNVIIKLSRAAVVRKWIIDTGSVQMQSGMIQKLKRELYNTRVSLDDLSSFKSIPKILSDFKDMFIFSKQGQRALDVEVQNLGDPSIKVADLEDARREIIALSGIPAPYLGYMDVVELREQLVHSNVTFATEISDMQELDNEALTRLLDIIAEIKDLDYIPSKYVKVSLIPPVVLIVQLIEMTLSSVGNIAGVFTNLRLPIDPYYFLEKYVPHIDWEKFKESAMSSDIETKAKEELGGGGRQGSPGGMY